MSLVLENARHLVELGYLKDIVQELGYAAHLIEASATVPYHTLTVRLEPDSQNRMREMACTFYPLTAEESQNLLMLQYFLELPFELTPEAQPQVYQLLMMLNNKAVLGHFGVTEGQKKIHHRYIQAFSESHLIFEEATSELISLFNFTSLVFGDAIEAVATQKKSPQEAMEDLA